MRVLLIVITLLAGATFAYSLVGRVHQWTDQSEITHILYPKEGSGLPKETLQKLTVQLNALELSQRRDWWVVRCVSGTTLLFGFSALVTERRRHGSKLPSISN